MHQPSAPPGVSLPTHTAPTATKGITHAGIQVSSCALHAHQASLVFCVVQFGPADSPVGQAVAPPLVHASMFKWQVRATGVRWPTTTGASTPAACHLTPIIRGKRFGKIAAVHWLSSAAERHLGDAAASDVVRHRGTITCVRAE